MLVVRRIDIIFNKYTPGRDGCRYEIQPLKIIPSLGHCLSIVLCMRYVFVCLYVCIGGLHRDSGRIQHQLLLAMPLTPLPLTPTPTPPFCCDTSLVPTDWTTRSPFMPPVHQLDCTLGSLCRRAWSCRFLPLFGF